MIWWLGGIGGLALLLLGTWMVWTGGVLKVTEEQRADAAKQKKELEELLKQPGWKQIEKWIAENVETRSNSVLYSPSEKPMEQEFTKGEISGLKMFIRVPEILLEQNTQILAAYAQERGTDNVD